MVIASWVYELLVDVDAQHTAIPRLALSWTPEDRGKAWVFDLRRGVQFHHGREFVAADVIHTFRRQLESDLGLTGAALYRDIEQIEALDQHTVRFTLRVPELRFPLWLAAYPGSIVPHDLTDSEIEARPRGTGPFTVERFVPGNRIAFRRNPSYWMSGRPYVDEIEAAFFADPASLAQALRGGAVDLASEVSPQLVKALRDEPDLQVQVWSFGELPRTAYERVREDRHEFEPVRQVPYAAVSWAPRATRATQRWADADRRAGQPGPLLAVARSRVQAGAPRPLSGLDARQLWLSDV